MTVLRNAKNLLNKVLLPFGMQIESLTAERTETGRLQQLVATRHFSEPVFPVLEQFKRCDPSSILCEMTKHATRFAEFAIGHPGGDSFSLANNYFTTPDAEVLYAIVRVHQPTTIIEVGLGNSTKLFRHAITDGDLKTKRTSIDPDHRCEIANFSDEMIRHRLEDIMDLGLFTSLEPSDALFMDLSHEIKPGQ